MCTFLHYYLIKSEMIYINDTLKLHLFLFPALSFILLKKTEVHGFKLENSTNKYKIKQNTRNAAAVRH